MSLLIKFAFWFVWSRANLWWSGTLSLVVPKDRSLESVLGWIEKLEAWLFHFQVESWKFLIAVVLAWPWYIFFWLKVIIYNFLLDWCFIICHCRRFIYLRSRLIFSDATMGTTSHIPPASVHQMSSSECLLDLYLLQLWRSFPMMNDLLMWLVYHPRIIHIWRLCHFKQTLTVIGAAILVKHVTQSWVGVLETKFIVIFKPQGAFLIRFGPAAHTCYCLWNFRIVGTWTNSLLIRVFFDRCKSCNQVSLMID